jgi:hypothetical protein
MMKLSPASNFGAQQYFDIYRFESIFTVNLCQMLCETKLVLQIKFTFQKIGVSHNFIHIMNESVANSIIAE